MNHRDSRETGAPKPKAVDLFAVGLLLKHLSLSQFLSVTSSIVLAQAKGEPFKNAPAPVDDCERYSRIQAGAAILLYRALQKMQHENPLGLCRTIMNASGARFLKQNLKGMNQDEIATMSVGEREATAQNMAELFFNAEMHFEEISDEAVRFNVRSCDFPRLCALASAPELAPLFCAVDRHYFDEVTDHIHFERHHTIANGDAACDFSLRFRDSIVSDEAENK